MKHSRRTFFKQGLAGALLLGTSTIARAALPDPVKPKAPKAVNRSIWEWRDILSLILI